MIIWNDSRWHDGFLWLKWILVIKSRIRSSLETVWNYARWKLYLRIIDLDFTLWKFCFFKYQIIIFNSFSAIHFTILAYLHFSFIIFIAYFKRHIILIFNVYHCCQVLINLVYACLIVCINSVCFSTKLYFLYAKYFVYYVLFDLVFLLFINIILLKFQLAYPLI